MSLEFHALTKIFHAARGPVPVLAGISCAIPRGALYSLEGANGAGKTTLLKIAAALVLPDSGSVLVCGAVPDKARSRCAFIADAERSFYQMLNIDENLAFYARLFGLTGKDYRRRRDELMAEMSFDPAWLTAPLHHCSSGMKQRAALIRGLIPRPQVILADEFTRALDETSSAAVTSYLRRWCAQGGTALAVTHDHAWALAHADRRLRLEQGMLSGGEGS